MSRQEEAKAEAAAEAEEAEEGGEGGGGGEGADAPSTRNVVLFNTWSSPPPLPSPADPPPAKVGL